LNTVIVAIPLPLCYNIRQQQGWLVLHSLKGGEAVLDFSFPEFYDFVITVLCMILSFFAGRWTNKKAKK